MKHEPTKAAETALIDCVTSLRHSGVGPLTSAEYMVRVATALVIMATRGEARFPTDVHLSILHKVIDDVASFNGETVADVFKRMN